ncbi:MAG: hypothetical protein JWQ27_1908 [Ferruginibacter sp.]|nr:hypothetical protein [Ferruginibacter sp.]
MKQLLVQYATYNLWANKRITDVIANLSDEQLHQQINSSFPTVFTTLLHLWDVENIWWERMRLQEYPAWPSASFSGSVVELISNLLQQSKQWKEWTDLATEKNLQHEFIYRNSKKDQFKQPVNEALHHLFNHQTFHRGQLITMLRQVGVTELPATDLIAFYRKK